MPTTETKLVTLEEYAKIPDPPGGRYELRHGKLVFAPYPVFGRVRIRRQIDIVLESLCPGWAVSIAFPFRPLPEYELWSADVGMVGMEHWNATDDDGWLAGAPDLVVMITGFSDAPQNLSDREHICFQGGCREFWVVDSKTQTIRVTTPDGVTRTYRIGGDIPLDRFVPAKLPVTDVFADSPPTVSK